MTFTSPRVPSVSPRLSRKRKRNRVARALLPVLVSCWRMQGNRQECLCHTSVPELRFRPERCRGGQQDKNVFMLILRTGGSGRFRPAIFLLLMYAATLAQAQ